MIERFLTAKRAEGASLNTIRGYRFDLKEFVKFLDGASITRAAIREFLQSLARRDIGKATAARKLSAAKSFCEWLATIGEVPSADAQGIARIRRPKIAITLPDVPSAENVALLLDGEFKTAFPERDRLILELLYSCGLRVSEAAGLSLEDIHPEQRSILIKGKGGKQRLVPVGRQLAKALAVYLPARRRKLQLPRMKKTPYLFFGLRNTKERIAPRSVARTLATVCKARGLRPMNPHLLRHACATHMLDNGAPLESIAQLLGHSRLSTAAHYSRVSSRLMLSAYHNAHPHSQKGI